MAQIITEPTEFRYCCLPDDGSAPIYTTFIVNPDDDPTTCPPPALRSTSAVHTPNTPVVPIPAGAVAGDQLIFISVSNGPTPDPAGSITPPVGATNLYTYPGQGFVPRVRIWTAPWDGTTTSFTFGGSPLPNPGFSVDNTATIIALQGPASITAGSGPNVTNSTSVSFPPVAASAGDTIIPILAVQNSDADDIASGPSGYLSWLDFTNPPPRRGVDVWGLPTFTGGTVTPPPATTANTSSGHVAFTLAATCEGDPVDPGCVIATQPTTFVGTIGTPINFGGSCTCGTGQWQQFVNAVWVDDTPPATVTATNINTIWRLCCEDECSNPVTITDNVSTGNIDDRVGNLDPNTPLVEEFCAGCPAIWEMRIDDALADEDNPANPVGDRIDSDPGAPQTPQPRSEVPCCVPPPGKPSYATSTSSLHWPTGTTIYWYSPAHADKAIVAAAFAEWQTLMTNITIVETSNIGLANVRVEYDYTLGSWSYVGTDNLQIPTPNATMNIGWSLAADNKTALHEVGHMLGLGHEHQNPLRPLMFDAAAAYAYYGGPPNNWTQADVDNNILNVDSGADASTAYDPDSIMHYAFPPSVISAPEPYASGGVDWDPEPNCISDGDKQWAAAVYGSPSNTLADDDWQRIVEADGQSCIQFSMVETWPDGVDPDTQGGPNEFFILYIRASCDGGVTWQEGSLRMEHD